MIVHFWTWDGQFYSLQGSLSNAVILLIDSLNLIGTNSKRIEFLDVFLVALFTKGSRTCTFEFEDTFLLSCDYNMKIIECLS